MARRRSNFRRGGSGQPRRRLFWARANGGGVLAPTTSARIDNLLEPFETAYGADLFGFTITRVVGVITWLERGTANPGWSQLSLGIRVADQGTIDQIDTDAERAQLIPEFDPFSDWMYSTNRFQYYSAQAETTEGWQELISSTNRFDVDLRSQRRLDELGQSLYLIAGNPNAVTNTQTDFRYDLNVLCKRP